MLAVRDYTQQRALHWLNVGRWWICGTGLFVIAPLVPEIFRDYRKWHQALGADSSTVGFWKTAFYLGIGRFAVEMLLVVAIFVILKPRTNMFRVTGTPNSSTHPKEDSSRGLR